MPGPPAKRLPAPRSSPRVWPGKPAPLGATWDGVGVNFALFSRHATGVDLCLFDDAADGVEAHRVRMTERTDFVWHAFLPDVRPGQLYGYRVHGPHAPSEGHRFNAYKLLIDPYALQISGPARLHPSNFGYDLGDPERDLSFSTANSAAHTPKCVVADPAFSWGDDRRWQRPWNRTVVYECHVKGLTARHPAAAPEHRGTFLGLASE
ncbi:MAG: glycogen debranching enzyme GlgX, partial [Actinobacteria bacterium]|nr:glycogen debranching enzyme GlgX [Actinomycetota bacterium]